MYLACTRLGCWRRGVGGAQHAQIMYASTRSRFHNGVAGESDEIRTPEQVLDVRTYLGTPARQIISRTVPGLHIGLFRGSRTLPAHGLSHGNASWRMPARRTARERCAVIQAIQCHHFSEFLPQRRACPRLVARFRCRRSRSCRSRRKKHPPPPAYRPCHAPTTAPAFPSPARW